MKTNLQIVADHYAASARGDLAGMLADVAPEVRWTEMAGFPCAGTWVGPQAVIDNVFAVLGRDWEGYRFTLELLVDRRGAGAQLYASSCQTRRIAIVAQLVAPEAL